MMEKQSILNDIEFIQWCYTGITEETLQSTKNVKILAKYKKKENKWGNDMVRKYIKKEHKDNNQWTTLLCEHAVKEMIKTVYKKDVNRCNYKSKLRPKKTYKPDWETDDYIYEVKGRNWTTSGTAGEKILGVPLKYSELIELSDKKVKIILIGYQEAEAKHDFGFGNLCDNNCNNKAKQILECFNKIGFEYIPFTKYLKKIGHEDGCWF